MKCDVNLNVTTNQEEHHVVLPNVSLQQQHITNRRKRKFRSKSKLKKQRTEEVPKLRFHHKPNQKQSDPQHFDSSSKLKETQALNSLKLLSMQIESSLRPTPVNQLESIFLAEFSDFQRESVKKEFRESIQKERSSISPFKYQLLKKSNHEDPVLHANPLSELSANDAEDNFPRYVSNSLGKDQPYNYYNRNLSYKTNDKNPKQSITSSNKTNPRVSDQPVLKERNRNIQNCSFSAQNSVFEDSERMIAPWPNSKMQENLPAFNASQELLKGQQQDQQMSKLKLKIPCSDLAMPISHQIQEPQWNRAEVNQENRNISLRNTKPQGEDSVYSRTWKSKTPLPKSRENPLGPHDIELDFKPLNISLNQVQPEVQLGEFKTVNNTEKINKSFLDNEKIIEQKRCRNGLVEPFHQKLRTKLQKINAKDMEISEKTPNAQIAGHCFSQVESLYVHGTQSLSWYNFPKKSISLRRRSSSKTPKQEDFWQQYHLKSNALRNDKNLIPGYLFENKNYEEQTPLRIKNTEELISQSTQVENSYLQMQVNSRFSVEDDSTGLMMINHEKPDKNLTVKVKGKIVAEPQIRRATSPLLLPQLLGSLAPNSETQARFRDYSANPEKRKDQNHLDGKRDFRIDHFNFIGVVDSEESLETFKKNLAPIVFAKNVRKTPIKPPKKLYI